MPPVLLFELVCSFLFTIDTKFATGSNAGVAFLPDIELDDGMDFDVDEMLFLKIALEFETYNLSKFRSQNEGKILK